MAEPTPNPTPNPEPNPEPTTAPEPSPEPTTAPEKTFTQAELDKIITREKEREKARIEKQYAMDEKDKAAFEAWKKTQKTPEQLKAEADAAAKAAMSEKDAKILALERKNALVDIGIFDPDARTFVETLAAKEMKEGDTADDFNEYAKKVWEKHGARFKADNEKAASGQKHGAPTPPPAPSRRDAIHERLYKK